jgi:hypothetical protein
MALVLAIGCAVVHAVGPCDACGGCEVGQYCPADVTNAIACPPGMGLNITNTDKLNGKLTHTRVDAGILRCRLCGVRRHMIVSIAFFVCTHMQVFTAPPRESMFLWRAPSTRTARAILVCPCRAATIVGATPNARLRRPAVRRTVTDPSTRPTLEACALDSLQITSVPIGCCV